MGYSVGFGGSQSGTRVGDFDVRCHRRQGPQKYAPVGDFRSRTADLRWMARGARMASVGELWGILEQESISSRPLGTCSTRLIRVGPVA